MPRANGAVRTQQSVIASLLTDQFSGQIQATPAARPAQSPVASIQFSRPRDHTPALSTHRPVQTAPPTAIPDGITIAISEAGKDCDAACTMRDLACAESTFAALNTCDIIRTHFECEAGCETNGGQAEAPAYVSFGVSKSLFPTMCFLAEDPETVRCAAAAGTVRRLCPCKASGDGV